MLTVFQVGFCFAELTNLIKYSIYICAVHTDRQIITSQIDWDFNYITLFNKHTQNLCFGGINEAEITS